MTDDLEETIEVFRMATGAQSVSLRLPVSRARPAEAVAVLAAVRGDDAAPSWWRPLCVVDAADPDGEPLMTFPFAADLHAMAVDRARWDAVPPSPLPDSGWHDVDEGWWAWLVVHDRWVFGAQTEFDAAMDAMSSHVPLAWSASGRAELGEAPISWFRVARSAWEDAWRLAIGRVQRPPA
jgi:hypothetical protein